MHLFVRVSWLSPDCVRQCGGRMAMWVESEGCFLVCCEMIIAVPSDQGVSSSWAHLISVVRSHPCTAYVQAATEKSRHRARGLRHSGGG